MTDHLRTTNEAQKLLERACWPVDVATDPVLAAMEAALFVHATGAQGEAMHDAVATAMPVNATDVERAMALGMILVLAGRH